MTARVNLRGAAVCVLCLVGFGIYASVVDRVYAVRDWLTWDLLLIWSVVATFSLACLSTGHFILKRVLRGAQGPALEVAVLSMAIGVVAFAQAMYVGGALHWYGPLFSSALSVLMIGLGLRDGIELVQRFWREATHPRQTSVWEVLGGTAGVLCVAVVYLGAMTPDALNYDATWYHLVIAQDFVREGGFVPFPADYNKSYPQLTGLISTWGWAFPGFDPPRRWTLSLHLEFSLFLWTLAGVSAGVRSLCGRQQLQATWATFFLFPVIFVYDHNLGGAADHICAFFAIPIALALQRLCIALNPAEGALLAICCAGALLTKYQAVYLIAPVALIAVGRWLCAWAALRRSQSGGAASSAPLRHLVWAPVVTAGVGLVLIAPHFIKQWVFHHNPVYPFMQPLFPNSWPTVPGGALIFERTAQEPAWRPRGSSLQKLVHAVRLLGTFSFHPHYSFNRNVPMFGSLFTLLLPALPFVSRRAGIALWAAVASGALLVWGMVYNVDRNLQIFMPIMVCVTGALLVQCWSLGALARAGMVPLAVLQIVWGADALIYSEHSRIQSAFDLLRSGFERRAHERWADYRSQFRAIDAALPSDARVLLHTSHLSLGIDREIYFDWAGYQGLIAYGHLHSPAELYTYYKTLGITHLLHTPGVRPAASKQEEVLWHALLPYCHVLGRFGEFELCVLPETKPPDVPAYRVAALGLAGYRDGVYDITRLGTDEYLPRSAQPYLAPDRELPADKAMRAQELAQVDAVLIANHALPMETASGWTRSFGPPKRLPGGFMLYLKAAPGAVKPLSSGRGPSPVEKSR